MLLALHDKAGHTIATKELEAGADFRRISNTDLLQFQGQYYGFACISQHVVIFEERTAPVMVDGWINKIPATECAKCA